MNAHSEREAFEVFFKEKALLYFNGDNPLNESILYSFLAPGKRIRPLLTLGFCQGFKGNREVALRCAVAIEMIHAYSLIHDDLPSMDNDDYRRGRLTNHKVFGEAMAILAGDSLLTFAPEFLLKELTLLKIPAEKILSLVELLLEASGHKGMVKGQALDMHYGKENLKNYDQSELEKILMNIHHLKTGSIITWSCLAGLYSQSDNALIDENSNQVANIGQRIGLMFQMVDDVLDIVADMNELGKTPGKDQKSQKITYTNLFGVDATILKIKDLANIIRTELGNFSGIGHWTIINDILTSLEKKIER